MTVSIRAKGAAVLAALSLMLTGCFISPGKFDSTLELHDKDRFTFTYEGEIFFLGLSSLAQMGAAADAADEAVEEPYCEDEETWEQRECTAAEIAEQKAQAQEAAKARAEKAKKDAQQMAAFMGGIDPTDPEAAEELRQLLLRQKGWNRVEITGEGVFSVTYSVTGRLGHDFMFPTIEGFPSTNPFVQMILRDNDVVRINAPGFAAQSDDNAMTGMMGGMAGLAGLANMGKEEGDDSIPAVPELSGTFTIVTHGGMKIRANNTDEGANPTPTGEMLEWDVSARSKAAPTALIDLSGA